MTMETFVVVVVVVAVAVAAVVVAVVVVAAAAVAVEKTAAAKEIAVEAVSPSAVVVAAVFVVVIVDAVVAVVAATVDAVASAAFADVAFAGAVAAAGDGGAWRSFLPTPERHCSTLTTGGREAAARRTRIPFVVAAAAVVAGVPDRAVVGIDLEQTLTEIEVAAEDDVAVVGVAA